MTDYLTKKLDGECVYASCSNACQADHLLCEYHAERHRDRNARYMRRVRGVRWLQLDWLDE